MTPEEFVAKYGITGGAESMKSMSKGDLRRIVYRCQFSLAAHDIKFVFNFNVTGTSPHLTTPLTPVTLVHVLLAQVTQNSRFAPATMPGEEFILNYTEEDVALVKKWMGDAMWSDFLTIMPA